MRERLTFLCEGAVCAASFDHGTRRDVGLLIVSGGNETLAGAHRGMAWLAAEIARRGWPVFRYDRRGVGDSDGDNAGFRGSAADIQAAAKAFRAASGVQAVVGFGNCDAATALALFGPAAGVDRVILANPWTFDEEVEEAAGGDMPALPPASAIRARYLARLKDPRQLWRLVSGGVDIRKLLSGLRAARRGAAPKAGLAAELVETLAALPVHATLLLARHDRTAMAFADAWSNAPSGARQRIPLHAFDTGSHGFADDAARAWLLEQVVSALD